MRSTVFSFLVVLIALVYDAEAIIGGEDAENDEFSFIVSLRNETNTHYCGGTLISRKHVITAAQCLYKDESVFSGRSSNKYSPESIKVVVNSGKSDKENVYNVAELIVHPDFKISDKMSVLNDIGVIILQQEVSDSSVKFQTLPSDLPQPDAKGMIAGWGFTNLGTETRPSTLQKLEVKVVDNQHCVSKWELVSDTDGLRKDIDTESVFCTESIEDGTGPCIRDSGSPLIIDGKFIGFIIGGFPCAVGIPDLYTAVGAHNDFIEKIIYSQSADEN